jgi:hypothetical protein
MDNTNIDGEKTLIVHFMTMSDYYDFAKLVGQNLTDKTKAIYYPKQERLPSKAYAWERQAPEPDPEPELS